MNELTVFRNDDLGSVRTISRDGEPWFVGKDVCRVLEIANHHDALKRLDFDEKDGVDITDPIGRPQRINIINESGLYALILSSRKPQAQAFKRWITHDVIPAIRKTGTYSVKPTITVDRDSLRIIIGATVAETLKQIMPLIQHQPPMIGPKPQRDRKPVLLKDFETVMRKVMREQRVSGNEIANRLNVAQATVSNWRNGKNQPNRENYLRFVMEFNVPVSDLGKGVF
jgi:prophage antirepressor-like protein